MDRNKIIVAVVLLVGCEYLIIKLHMFVIRNHWMLVFLNLTYAFILVTTVPRHMVQTKQSRIATVVELTLLLQLHKGANLSGEIPRP